MRLRKNLSVLFIVIMLLCSISRTAFASETPDLSRQGSIHITMRQGDTVVPGGSMTLYLAGVIREAGGDYSFELTGDFAGCGLTLEDIQSAELAEALSEYAVSHKLTGETKTVGSDGEVFFDGLNPGLYLMVQEQAAEGYNQAEPFLVSIPMREADRYVYDVDASPKVEIKKASAPGESETPERPGEPGNGGPKLPQTGQLNWPVPVLTVAGLILFSIGWVLRFGKKNRYEE